MPYDDQSGGGKGDGYKAISPSEGVASSDPTGHEKDAQESVSRVEVQALTPEFRVKYKAFLQPNPYRIAGKGTAKVVDRHLVLTGPLTRFMFSRQELISLPLEQISDVRVKGKEVSFTVPREGKPGAWGTLPGPMRLGLEDEGQARELAAALPERVSLQQVESAEFEAKIQASSSFHPVAIVLIVANVAAFALFAITEGGWMAADGRALIRWGSNFGPYTTDGQWWRLVTATFLHGGIIHLSVNMWTLYDVGRMCEKMYGPARFLGLYLLSGIFGSAVSIWWNPVVNSVGASGALFGVIGGTLVFMLDKRNGVPPSIMAKHGSSLALFAIYGIWSGFGNTGIDNAAHVGGLICGIVAGFSLARPLGSSSENRSPSYLRAVSGLALCALAVIALAGMTPRTLRGMELEQRFQEDLKWLAAEEKKLMEETQKLLTKLKSKARQAIDDDTKQGFAVVRKGWDDAHKRFSSYELDQKSRLKELHQDMIAYSQSRYGAITAIAAAMDSTNESEANSKAEEFMRLWNKSDATAKRIGERIQRISSKK